MNVRLSAIPCLVLLACDTSEPADVVRDTGMVGADPCQATALEEDFALFEGASDPATWTNIPGDAVVAATYLKLNPDNLDVFQQVSGAVIGDLMSGREGLLFVSTAESQICGIARTLTVWTDEAAMMDFVVGDAHLAAMAEVGRISRGGSITDHWPAGELDSVDFAGVATAFEGHDGPVY